MLSVFLKNATTQRPPMYRTGSKKSYHQLEAFTNYSKLATIQFSKNTYQLLFVQKQQSIDNLNLPIVKVSVRSKPLLSLTSCRQRVWLAEFANEACRSACGLAILWLLKLNENLLRLL